MVMVDVGSTWLSFLNTHAKPKVVRESSVFAFAALYAALKWHGEPFPRPTRLSISPAQHLRASPPRTRVSSSLHAPASCSRRRLQHRGQIRMRCRRGAPWASR